MKHYTITITTLPRKYPLTTVKRQDTKPARVSEYPFLCPEDNTQKVTRLYKEYSKELFRYCFLRVSSREKASDLVQETFVRVWQYLIKGNSITSEKAFLYTTLRHLIIDEYRKKKNVSLEMLVNTREEPSSNTEEVYSLVEMNHIIRYIYQLPCIYSSALIMRYVEDSSVKDIALSCKKSESVVSVRIHRGLEKLRKLVVI